MLGAFGDRRLVLNLAVQQVLQAHHLLSGVGFQFWGFGFHSCVLDLGICGLGFGVWGLGFAVEG